MDERWFVGSVDAVSVFVSIDECEPIELLVSRGTKKQRIVFTT